MLYGYGYMAYLCYYTVILNKGFVFPCVSPYLNPTPFVTSGLCMLLYDSVTQFQKGKSKNVHFFLPVMQQQAA